MTGSGAHDEQKVRDVINKDGKFMWHGEEYRVIFCDKPTLGHDIGEPKTDTFVRAVNKKTNKQKDFKISTKKTDFAYLENHPMKKKLFEFFGPECKEIMISMHRSLQGKFQDENPINFGEGKEEKGITLGWRNEYLQENTTRSLGIRLTQNIANKVWWGEGSPKEYLDAKVNGGIITDSGMPDWILVKDAKDIKTANDVFSDLKDIKEFAKTHKLVDSTYQAHNYKMHRKKTCTCGEIYRVKLVVQKRYWIGGKIPDSFYEANTCPYCRSRKWKTVTCPECGTVCKLNKKQCTACKKEIQEYISWNPQEGDSRELAVWYKFEAINGNLSYKLVLDEPFKKAGEVRINLQECLKEIGVSDDQNFNISELKGKIVSNN